ARKRAGRPAQLGQGLGEQARPAHPAIADSSLFLRGPPSGSNALTGQMDHGIEPLQSGCLDDSAGWVPVNSSRLPRRAGQTGNCVPLRFEPPNQCRADETTGTGDENLHKLSVVSCQLSVLSE